jgi:hypothetical protein
MTRLVLQPQEPAYDDAESCHMFLTDIVVSPLYVTIGVKRKFDMATVTTCLYQLQHLARQHKGLDFLQVFEDPDDANNVLWFIEDAPGVVTALLPEER